MRGRLTYLAAAVALLALGASVGRARSSTAGCGPRLASPGYTSSVEHAVASLKRASSSMMRIRLIALSSRAAESSTERSAS